MIPDSHLRMAQQAPNRDQRSKTPAVTVYIPCHNYGRFLAESVASMHGQLFKGWELFIVDDGSTDDTPAIASRLRQECSDKIEVIRNESPCGLQKAANTVLERASGRYIMRLDADDWLDEAALLLMVAKLDSDPSLGIVYGNYFYTDEAGRILGMERRFKLGLEDTVGHLPPHGACTMVRTRVLKSVGGYSEDVNAQDGWELWYKLSRRTKAASLEAPIFYYRQHSSSLSRNSSRLLAARTKIFSKLGEQLKGSYTPTCLAVIGVRESYLDFEGVPYKELGGRSLLLRALDSATAACGVTAVLVSSNSESVLRYCEEMEGTGQASAHMRAHRGGAITDSHLPIRDILLQSGETYRERYGAYPDIVSFLSIHAPFRRAEHLEKGVNALRITCSDSIISVTEEREPVFAHGTDGLRLLNPGRLLNLAYDRERLYKFNGAFVMSWWEVVLSGDLFGQKIGYIEMSAEDSVQIKCAEDLLGASARFAPDSKSTR